MPAGMFLVDGGGVADTSESVMRERQQLSAEGMFIVVARVNGQNGALLGPPDVISRGFAGPQSANGFAEESIEVVSRTLRAHRRTPRYRPRGAEERHPQGSLRLPLRAHGPATDHPATNS